MKNKYSVPELQFTEISSKDILTVSPVQTTLEDILYVGDGLDVVDRVTW